LCDLFDAHLLTLVQRIGGIQHNPIRRFEALQDFQRCSIVAADGQLAEMGFVIGIYDDGAQALCSE
jgi:hypothetical protein